MDAILLFWLVRKSEVYRVTMVTEQRTRGSMFRTLFSVEAWSAQGNHGDRTEPSGVGFLLAYR